MGDRGTEPGPTVQVSNGLTDMKDALRGHWPEYLIEAAGLGLFMVSACGFGTLLGHPGSPVVRALGDPLLLRLLMGLAMGATVVARIYSPSGQRSGAHFNPAITLMFCQLGTTG